MSTARAILTAAFQDIGAFQSGQPIPAADAQDALTRLNNLVASWRAQSLTAVAVERQLFNVVANQQTYSIGSGGDFDVPRPQAINGAGLLLNGLTAARSLTITRSGTTATGTLVSHAFTAGEQVFIDGATETAYNGIQTVASVPTSGTFTFRVFNSPVTPATGSPTVAAFDGQPVEIQIAAMTDDAWQWVGIKTLTGSQFTNVYYNPTQPLGQITLWPIPNTAANQLVLYLESNFEGFANLSTDYTYPDVPGYAEALQYNLALRLAIPYGRPATDEIREMARTSLGIVKRANYKLSDLPTDPAITNSRIGGYNINTGTGG